MNRKESLFDSMGGPEKGRLVLDMVFEEIVHSPGPDKVVTVPGFGAGPEG